MNWLPFLKKAALIGAVAAPEVVSAVNPLAGAVLAQVLQSEAVHGPGKGKEKKDFVMAALPMVVPFIEAITGKDIVDDDKFTKALGDLVDATVAVLNSINAFPKAA